MFFNGSGCIYDDATNTVFIIYKISVHISIFFMQCLWKISYFCKKKSKSIKFPTINVTLHVIKIPSINNNFYYYQTFFHQWWIHNLNRYWFICAWSNETLIFINITMLTSKYLMEAKRYGLSLILTFTDISYKDTNYHVKNESLVFLQVSSVIKTGQLTLTKFIGLFPFTNAFFL